MSGLEGQRLNNRQVQLLAVTSTCLALSTVAVTLRLFARWSSAAKFWWDDWVAVLALVRLSRRPWQDRTLTYSGILGNFMAREYLHHCRYELRA